MQGKCLNFAEQVDLFQETVEKKLPKHFANSTELSYYLSKSIFVISIGNNDFLNNYIQPNLYPTSKLYNPQSFAQHLTDSLSQQFQVFSLSQNYFSTSLDLFFLLGFNYMKRFWISQNWIRRIFLQNILNIYKRWVLDAKYFTSRIISLV